MCGGRDEVSSTLLDCLAKSVRPGFLHWLGCYQISHRNALGACLYVTIRADASRGDRKQSQYGRVVLPFALLRRLECLLELTKFTVLAQAEKTNEH